MRKAVLGICLLTFLSSCGDRKVKMDPFVAVTSMIDSVATKTKEERPAEPPADDKPIHTEADELFDDFFFTYASDSILQKQRTKFPLPYYIGDSAIKIQEGHWEYQRLFPDENFYTLLFDREEDMDLVGDTSLNSVQVEWFDLNSRLSRKLYFERIRGIWMLEAVNERAMHRGENGGFVDFYSRFAQDSLYQSSHISHSRIHVSGTYSMTYGFILLHYRLVRLAVSILARCISPLVEKEFRLIQVFPVSGHKIQLRQSHFSDLMSRNAHRLAFIRPDRLTYTVGIFDGYVKKIPLACGLIMSHRPFNHVSEIIKLMAQLFNLFPTL